MNRDRCPRCDGRATDRVHVEWHRDMVEEIRVCRSCPAEFINRYDLFESEVTHVDE